MFLVPKHDLSQMVLSNLMLLVKILNGETGMMISHNNWSLLILLINLVVTLINQIIYIAFLLLCLTLLFSKKVTVQTKQTYSELCRTISNLFLTFGYLYDTLTNLILNNYISFFISSICWISYSWSKTTVCFTILVMHNEIT